MRKTENVHVHVWILRRQTDGMETQNIESWCQGGKERQIQREGERGIEKKIL